MTAAKAVSVGLLLTDGTRFLGCHSTGNRFYDLPKGAAEPGETPRQTCVRETREETGLEVEGERLLDLGILPYNRQKELHLFALTVPELPDAASLSCSSVFVHPYRHVALPEVDGYLHIKFEETAAFMTPNMAKAVAEAKRRLDAAQRQRTAASDPVPPD
jgi:8-oxo-dGTP pyrophosphatase MutT (NUDIX family)